MEHINDALSVKEIVKYLKSGGSLLRRSFITASGVPHCSELFRDSSFITETAAMLNPLFSSNHRCSTKEPFVPKCEFLTPVPTPKYGILCCCLVIILTTGGI